MDHYKIHIEGKQFEKHYLIYIIRLKYQNKYNHYYIGQTGDRFYRTARPAFRRLAGHLEDKGYSTQNQLYKGIANQILKLEFEPKKSFPDKVKDAVSQYLEQSEIDMFVFPVMKFDSRSGPSRHRENVRFIENVEKHLIKKFIGCFSAEKVLNKKTEQPSDDLKTAEKAEDILREISKEIA